MEKEGKASLLFYFTQTKPAAPNLKIMQESSQIGTTCFPWVAADKTQSRPIVKYQRLEPHVDDENNVGEFTLIKSNQNMTTPNLWLCHGVTSPLLPHTNRGLTGVGTNSHSLKGCFLTSALISVHMLAICVNWLLFLNA